MRFAFMTAALCLLALSSAGAQRKYELKSGIITFENTVAILGKQVPQKQVLYFDDYGVRERKELYEGDVLQEAYLCDGMHLFNLVYAESTAYRGGNSTQGTETRLDGDSLAAKWKGKGAVKKLPAVKLAGKICDAFEVTDAGGTTTLAGWNRIILMTEGSASGIHSVSKAVKIVENAKIPGDMFRVPAGFKVK
jgi:hypothetical protein